MQYQNKMHLLWLLMKFTAYASILLLDATISKLVYCIVYKEDGHLPIWILPFFFYAAHEVGCAAVKPFFFYSYLVVTQMPKSRESIIVQRISSSAISYAQFKVRERELMMAQKRARSAKTQKEQEECNNEIAYRKSCLEEWVIKYGMERAYNILYHPNDNDNPPINFYTVDGEHIWEVADSVNDDELVVTTDVFSRTMEESMAAGM